MSATEKPPHYSEHTTTSTEVDMPELSSEVHSFDWGLNLITPPDEDFGEMFYTDFAREDFFNDPQLTILQSGMLLFS